VTLPTFADDRALIASGPCAAVLIATPHPHHAPVAIDAARRGLHVLVEKPRVT
jgi:predicted dehydrogenase